MKIPPRALLSLTLVLAYGSPAAAAPELIFKPFHEDGIYAAGERVGWTVSPAPGTAATGTYSYTIKTDQLVPIGSGTFDLKSGSATIAVSLDHPASVYVTVDDAAPPAPSAADVSKVNDALKAVLVDKDPSLKAVFAAYPDYCILAAPCSPTVSTQATHLAVLGAMVDPAGLQPSASRPADFGAFWAGKLADLRKVPMNPVLVPIPIAQPGVKVYRVQLDSLNSHVHGYLAVPDRKGRFPALVIYQWAGVYALSPDWAANRAAEGWLAFDVDSHDLPPEEADGVPATYPAIGNTNRETSYFLNMYLRDTRALDWVRTLRRWDHKTVVVNGTSMGGQQSLVTAGLNPGKITAVVVNEPSGADTNGDLHGRKSGYPNWPNSDPRVAETALYFDTVNFAPRITAPTLMAIGFIDRTCPPTGLWTELDLIPGPKEAVPMIESDHNNITPDKQGAYLQRSEEVLANLLQGRKFVPNESLTRRPQ
ncbi:MAG: acetylxylan esterase [Alphaproteobacteria bacterium]|nr:acetylxylan esterase [Alphaproteobacteria bacterium]